MENDLRKKLDAIQFAAIESIEKSSEVEKAEDKEFGENVPAGDLLAVGTDGVAMKATAGKFILAQALANGTSGEAIQVQIIKAGYAVYRRNESSPRTGICEEIIGKKTVGGLISMEFIKEISTLEKFAAEKISEPEKSVEKKIFPKENSTT